MSEQLPEWAKWVATDRDGGIWCFDGQPESASVSWNYVGRYKHIGHSAAPAPVENWRETLREVHKSIDDATPAEWDAASQAVRKPTAARDEGSPYYKEMSLEPWDVIDTWPLEQRIGFYRGNLLKYTMRMGSKDAAPQEIKKAEHYAKKLQEVLKETEK